MTTIAYRNHTLAADRCLTWFENVKSDAPSSRSYGKKIRLAEVDQYRRIAIATRGDAVDGVLIERLVIKHLKAALADEKEGDDLLGWDDWNDWGVDIDGITWNAPDDEQNGIIVYRDLRVEGKIHAFEIQEPRVISRIEKGQFVAVGCDAPLAYAAMEAGSSASHAVWIAGKYGTATAGPVDFVTAGTMVLNTQRMNPLEKP